MSKIQKLLERSWVQPNMLTWLLAPLSIVYRVLVSLRRSLYSAGVLRRFNAPVPVIVVGNLTVGGNGKTPIVIYLVEELKQAGYKPAVISRGYRASPASYPFLVNADTPPQLGGDEPTLIARRTRVPVMIGADREASIDKLMTDFDIDVIVSDDGLQHLAMGRDIEICVTDPKTTKNTLMLPAGPYREPRQRLANSDFIISTAPVGDLDIFIMTLEAEPPRALKPVSGVNFAPNSGVHKVTGIANPERFFATCMDLGFKGSEHSFPDHHEFQPEEINFNDALPVLMTEKDAVKCEDFASSAHWKLPVSVKLEPNLITAVVSRLNQCESNND